MSEATPDLETLSDAEVADWYLGAGRTTDPADEVEVEVDVAPTLDVTMSFRLPAEEADAIRTHAGDAGVTMSRWIRDACAEHARGHDRDPSDPSADGHLVELGLLARRFADVLDELQVRVERSSATQERLLDSFVDPVAYLRTHLAGTQLPSALAAWPSTSREDAVERGRHGVS